MLVLGTNPRISNRGHNATESFRRFVEDPARTLVVVDPRETETTRAAHRHLRVRPGTDSYLLLGMAAAIVRNGLVDAAFVRDKTRDFAEPLDAGESVDDLAVDYGMERPEIEEAVVYERAA